MISYTFLRDRKGQGAKDYPTLDIKLEGKCLFVNTLTNGFDDCKFYACRIAQGLDEGNEQDLYVLKECFLDLGLFPADRKICADALLDIWVYVRKLQRHDAFAISSELASRNLLNLTSNARGSTTIQYVNASEEYFSQNDGTRDLALYLRHNDNILHRKRLVIERKDFCSLKEWELLRDRAFDTQILSILTGPMEENDWCDMNFHAGTISGIYLVQNF
ncbi:hypothetical protein SUGI_0358870 [Cryptomeria japonica]|nr:hypothetical protein SUGI_0358870 [Cryptomeria japonica]